MIARGKRRFAALVLLVFAAWPLAHFGLVRSYRLDPWKFGGWAMYTSVNFIPLIDVYAVRGDTREQLGLGGHGFPASREAHEQLVFDVNYYGELADLGPLARATAAEAGQDAVIEIVIRRFFLDSKSARVSATRRSHFFEDGVEARH